MKAPNEENFSESVERELNVYIDNNHWGLVTRSQLPKEQDYPKSVWQMIINIYI